MRCFPRQFRYGLSRAVLIWLGCALPLAAEMPAMKNPTPADPPPVEPIAPAGFLGWPDAVRLENEHIEAVLVPAIGRLVHMAPRNGVNLLRLDPALHGAVPPENDPFFNIGGNWFWPVAQSSWSRLDPGGRDWPPPAVLADVPWTCSAWIDADGAQCARLVRAYGDPLHIQATRLFRLAPDSDYLEIRQRIERTGPSDIPITLWNISQVKGADAILLPVDESSGFPGGLKSLLGSLPDDRMTICGPTAVFHPGDGAETKIGSDSPRAWIAAVQADRLLFMSARTSAAGPFPDGGCTVELFSNATYGYSEVETFSPEIVLEPGHVLENTGRLAVTVLKTVPAPCEAARAAAVLAGENPPPP